MAVEWTYVRMPVELRDRLARLAAGMLESYRERSGKLPGTFCEQVPLHHVIARMADEYEGHRRRAREQARRHRRPPTEPTRPDDVHTINEQENVNE